jgi:DNA repair protein RecO (recombination protein O)
VDMLHKTQGIVFRFTKYGETSIIVNIFTELFGLQSYIVNGVRSKGAKQRIALFQPLTLVDLVVYHRENANINRISEIKCLHPYQSIPMDVRKSTVAIFLNEVINKTIREESHARDLCNFMIQSFIAFDELTDNAENFHLIFLIRLSRWLGFGAHHVNEILGVRMTDKDTEEILNQLLACEYDEWIQITNDQRRELLDLILRFYRDHIESMGELKSVQVLREVLN